MAKRQLFCDNCKNTEEIDIPDDVLKTFSDDKEVRRKQEIDWVKEHGYKICARCGQPWNTILPHT